MINICDDGYDFYVADLLSKWTRENLYDHAVTGVDWMENLGFEDIRMPAGTYVVFKTEHLQDPIEAFHDIRQRIVSEWLPTSGYRLVDAPDVSKLHWPAGSDQKQIEV